MELYSLYLSKYSSMGRDKEIIILKFMDIRFSASRRISHKLEAGRPQTADGRGLNINI